MLVIDVDVGGFINLILVIVCLDSVELIKFVNSVFFEFVVKNGINLNFVNFVEFLV